LKKLKKIVAYAPIFKMCEKIEIIKKLGLIPQFSKCTQKILKNFKKIWANAKFSKRAKIF
jgi:hypothetical protein